MVNKLQGKRSLHRTVRYNFNQACLEPDVLLKNDKRRDWTTRVKPLLKRFHIKIHDIRESYTSIAHVFNKVKLNEGRPVYLRVELNGEIQKKLLIIPANAVNRESVEIKPAEDISNEEKTFN